MLYVMCGCPGSGKTTWCKKNLANNANRERVVPEYAIRRMFFRMQEERPRKEGGFSEIRLI